MQEKSKDNTRGAPSSVEHSVGEHISPLHSARFPAAISPVSLIIRQVILEDEASRTLTANLKAQRKEIVEKITAEIEATPARQLSMANIEKKYTREIRATFDTFANTIRGISLVDPEKSSLLIQHRLQIDNAFALSVFALFSKDPATLNDASLLHIRQVAALGGAKLAKFLDQIFLEPIDIQPKPETLENFCSLVTPAVVLDAARILSRRYESERTKPRGELLNLFQLHAVFHPSTGDQFHDVGKGVYATSTSHDCRQRIAELALRQGADYAPLYRAIAMNYRNAWSERRNQAVRHLYRTFNETDPASLDILAPFLRDPSPLIVHDTVRLLLTAPVAGLHGEAILKREIMGMIEARNSSIALCTLFLLTGADTDRAEPKYLGSAAFRVIKAVLGERTLSRAEIDAIIPKGGFSFSEGSLAHVNRTEYKHISELLVATRPTDRLIELIVNQSLVSRNTDSILRSMSDVTRDTFDRTLRRHIKDASVPARKEMYRAAELDFQRDGTHGD